MYINLAHDFFRGRHTPPKPAATQHYSNSEPVRDWLVLQALSCNRVDLMDDLQHKLEISFFRASSALKKGLVSLDYRPQTEDRVDIPASEHPHYTQALLYWGTRLHCTPNLLVEAYARLGSLPLCDDTLTMLRRVEQEDAPTQRRPGNLRRGRAVQDTIPIFGPTHVGAYA